MFRHTNDSSTIQSKLHPSPDTKFPSSHSSPSSIIEFPQIAFKTQGSPSLGQMNPSSIKQTSEHPSPAWLLESSQSSISIMIPSPQTLTQIDGAVRLPPVQLQPGTLL